MKTSGRGLFAALLLALAWVPAQAATPVASWNGIGFLLGDCAWYGGGKPGVGTGTAAFRVELGGTVLVATGAVSFPATAAREAFTHRDRLTFYRDPADSALRAIYFDDEQHVIAYRATAGTSADSLVLVSDAAPGGTRCRLTYVRDGADALRQRFELAPPGKPDAFAPYLEFTAKRVGGSATRGRAGRAR